VRKKDKVHVLISWASRGCVWYTVTVISVRGGENAFS